MEFFTQNSFNVQVTWDAGAEMWVTDSDDIPGLAAEAPDDKALWRKLETLIPELLILNHVRLKPKKDIEIVLNFQSRKARIQSPKAAQMSSYTPDLKKILKRHGCRYDRAGKGDHEIWYSRINGHKFPVDSRIRSRDMVPRLDDDA